MNINNLLDGVHVLIVDDERMSRALLSAMFQTLGATVHRKNTQMQAIGEYFRMFKSGVTPRCVITDWWLKDQNDDAYKMLKRIKCTDIHATSAMLLETVHELDNDALTIVYSSNYRDALKGIKRHHPQAELVPKKVEPVDLAIKIVNHPKILSQSVTLTTEEKQTIVDTLKDVSTKVRERVYLNTDTHYAIQPF